MVNLIDVTGGGRSPYWSHPQAGQSRQGGTNVQIGGGQDMDALLRMMLQQQMMASQNRQFDLSQKNMMDALKLQMGQADKRAGDQMKMFRENLEEQQANSQAERTALLKRLELSERDIADNKTFNMLGVANDLLRAIQSNFQAGHKGKAEYEKTVRQDEQTKRDEVNDEAGQRIDRQLASLDHSFEMAFNPEFGERTRTLYREKMENTLRKLNSIYNGQPSADRYVLEKRGYEGRFNDLVGRLEELSTIGDTGWLFPGVREEARGFLDRAGFNELTLGEPMSATEAAAYQAVPRSAAEKDATKNALTAAGDPGFNAQRLSLLEAALDPNGSMDSIRQVVRGTIDQIDALQEGQLAKGDPLAQEPAPATIPPQAAAELDRMFSVFDLTDGQAGTSTANAGINIIPDEYGYPITTLDVTPDGLQADRNYYNPSSFGYRPYGDK